MLTFNRATDLRTFEPIAGLDVACLASSCRRPFRLLGDRINPAHEMLVFDCDALLARKQYMQVILSLAQALEMLYARYLHVTLVERLADTRTWLNYEEINALSAALHGRTHSYAASKMRRAFFSVVLTHPGPEPIDVAAAAISGLPGPKELPREEALLAVPIPRVGPLLVRLRDSMIDDLRNRVVHKQGYRPTRDETESALNDAHDLVQPLSWKLGLDGPPLPGLRRPW